MRRRTAALLLCVALVFQLAAPAGAAQTVVFTAVGDNVLPLTDETMPFWSSGYLYIPSTIFTGAARDSLGISRIPNAHQVILYVGGQHLRFEVGKTYAQDTEGNTYYPGAVQRNGIIFVPAAVVAKYFNLLYSTVELENDPFRDAAYQGSLLVWLRQQGYSLSDRNFADAASNAMSARYADYLKAKEQGQDDQENSGDGETAPAFSGKSVYLCVKAADHRLVGELLDVLDRYGSQAAFYCTPDFLEEQGDLLRRMAATGQAVGILADGADPDRSLEAQLEAGNAALERAVCGKTRLVWLENADAGAVQQVEAMGFCRLTPDLDRSAYGLWSVSGADTLLRRVNARPGGVSVWLADQVGASGLRAFLAAAADTEDSCLAVTETA